MITLLPKRIEISSGVALNIIPHNRFKTNTISVRFLCPMAEETVALNALLPYVLKRGCKRLPDMTSFSKELQMLYGSEMSSQLGKMGDTQFFGFVSHPLCDTYTEGVNVTNDILSLMFELFTSPLLENGSLKADYVEGEKAMMIDRVNDAINNKISYALKRCFEEMGKDAPSSLPETGTVALIEKITPEALTNTLKAAIESYRIEIWCAGMFDEAALTKTCSDIFASVKRVPCPPLSLNTIKENSELNDVTEDQPVLQGKLSLGFTTSVRPYTKDAPLYNLFLEILANSPTAKLFSNVREKLSLCYYCYAIPDRLKGTMIITSGIETDNKEKAMTAIIKELEECKNGNISENELESAKKSFLSSAKSISDDCDALISWYFSQLFSSERIYDPEEYAKMGMSATPSDIARIANTFKLHTVYFLNGTLKAEEE